MVASLTRVALVTGSGKKRVGGYVADALAGHGYAVAVHYHTSASEANDTVEHLRGRRVQSAAFQANLADGEAARDLVRAVLERFGRLDVLINCAAVWKAKRLEPAEIELLRHLQVRFGHVSCERVCSGSGITNLYDYLKHSGAAAASPGVAARLAAAEDRTPLILQAGLDSQEPCALCAATIRLFISILGAEAGNLTLKVLATGGVYLGGGIPRRILPALADGSFLSRRPKCWFGSGARPGPCWMKPGRRQLTITAFGSAPRWCSRWEPRSSSRENSSRANGLS